MSPAELCTANFLHLISPYDIIVAKGNSNNLMKITAKRRRTKAQIQMDKLQEQRKGADMAQQLAQMEEMKQQMAMMQEQLSQNQVTRGKSSKCSTW